MRRFLVGIALAVTSSAVAPGVARADVTFPPIPLNVNPSTVTWFYGCADALPGACLTMGIAPSTNNGTFFGFYGSGVDLLTPSGVRYNIGDTWGWSLPDGTCSGLSSEIQWTPNSCFVQNLPFERLTSRVIWSTGSNPSLPPFNIAPLTLTAVPEPSSMVLAAAGLLVLGGVGVSHRRRSAR
jgi:hypothetical protein